MPIEFSDLAPYKTLLLCDVPARWNFDDAVQEMADSAGSQKFIEVAPAISAATTRKGLRIKFFHYRVDPVPSWLASAKLHDQEHHLVVVMRRQNRLVVLATESRFRNRLTRLIKKGGDTPVGKLTIVPPAVLNAAYVRGPTKYLWMSAIRRRVASRADSKALGGSDLQQTINPLSDQGYFFSAAVSSLPNQAFHQPVGASPRKGQIWAGSTANLGTLCEDVNTLLDIAAGIVAPVDNPIRALAAPVTDPVALNAIADPYSAAVIPMELLNDGLNDDQRAYAEKCSRLEFVISNGNGLHFDAELKISDGVNPQTSLGSVHFQFDTADPHQIGWEVSTVACPAAIQAEHDEAVDALNEQRDWLKVWYGTGHTLANQTIFSETFRDMVFEHTWVDFGNTLISREKPQVLHHQNIGGDRSLFCWVKNHWRRDMNAGGPARGWLACNDGSMEISDFIHFDLVDGVGELTLIHVKACGDTEADRQLAITDYELVISQAVKNLRFLDNVTTAAEFSVFVDARVMDGVWNAGVAATRAAMVAAIRAQGSNYHRRVVIVQPRVTRAALVAARTGANRKQKRIRACAAERSPSSCRRRPGGEEEMRFCWQVNRQGRSRLRAPLFSSHILRIRRFVVSSLSGVAHRPKMTPPCSSVTFYFDSSGWAWR